jgi:uncharacterized protein (TIGR00251 family)
MDLEQAFAESFAGGKSVKIMVRPNSKENKLLDYKGEGFKISIKARPEKGAANAELVKFTSRLLKKHVVIASGLTSKTKILRLSE